MKIKHKAVNKKGRILDSLTNEYDTIIFNSKSFQVDENSITRINHRLLWLSLESLPYLEWRDCNNEMIVFTLEEFKQFAIQANRKFESKLMYVWNRL